MKPVLLLGTYNLGKIKEIKAILSSLQGAILSPQELALDIVVAETGNTYSENARIKAEAFHQETGFPVLADDSGLEVDVLNGAPGIFSARYSKKENATDADRRAYLRYQLKGKPQPWTAHFHCSAALILSDGDILERNGHCHGVIIPDERGNGGFGYDPIFFLPEYQATMAELRPDIKNQISHRAKAMLALLDDLKKLQ